MAEKLTPKQQRFCDEYLVDLNAERAAVRAGYSKRYARGNAHKLVAHGGIKQFISKRMAEKEKELIADQNEVMQYLTAVMRGDDKAENVMVNAMGELERVPVVVQGNRLKAAELLGKAHGIYSEKISAEIDSEINIKIDYGENK